MRRRIVERIVAMLRCYYHKSKRPVLILFFAGLSLLGIRPDKVCAATKEAVAKANAGNAAYAEGQYEQALEAYKLAEVEAPESPELAYNQGLAYYRMRDFAKAKEMFGEALTTRDLELEAKIKYNLGNVAYSQALEKQSAIKEAIELAQQAIMHYRDAIDLNPNDRDAKANAEVAQLLIKDLLDKQKQQQEQQQQDQQQQEQKDQQDQQQCDNPQQQNQDGEKEQQEDLQQEQQEGQEGDEQKQQEQQQQQGEEEGEKQKQQEGQEQQQEGEQQQQGEQDQQQQQQQAQQSDGEQEAQAKEGEELTREVAEAKLQKIRDMEAKRREELARRARIQHVPVKKDW